MGVTITCYGGVNEIGGNKILVADRDTKVFLDFGAGFSEGAPYYSSGIEPRSVNGAGDHFEFGLLPEIPGIYSRDALQNTELKHTAPEIDAVLLSHYHSDHTGRINFLDPKIPIYCGETTALIHRAASESGRSPLDGHEIRTFRTGDTLRIGNMEIQPIHVDHSIPGTYGFILHTSSGPVAYTADFRFHGPMGAMTEEFVSKAGKEKPVALISEGTRVSPQDHKQDLTESQVANKTANVLRKTNGLAFSSFRGNDIDRVVSFYKACGEADRSLVVSMKTAHLLETLREDQHLKVPKVGKDVFVYVRRKGSGDYDDRHYYKWERSFLDGGLTARDVKHKQDALFLHLDAWYFPELIDIQPDKGGSYIHASTEAFNEEGEQEDEVVRNWTEHFGFSYHQIHASGHASMEGVASLVNRINGKSVIPVHTERPELFPSIAGTSRVLPPAKGKAIILD